MSFERHTLRASSPDKQRVAKYQHALEQRELLEVTKPNPTILKNTVRKELENTKFTPSTIISKIPATKVDPRRTVLVEVTWQPEE